METKIDQAAGVIVKSDQTGRTRYTSEYKREVLGAFESSTLSAPAFARQCGSKYPTLAAWIGRGNVVIKPQAAGTLLPSPLPSSCHPQSDRRSKSNSRDMHKSFNGLCALVRATNSNSIPSAAPPSSSTTIPANSSSSPLP
jgi:hypothetical protein